jgi:hypothetical protein
MGLFERVAVLVCQAHHSPHCCGLCRAPDALGCPVREGCYDPYIDAICSALLDRSRNKLIIRINNSDEPPTQALRPPRR